MLKFFGFDSGIAKPPRPVPKAVKLPARFDFTNEVGGVCACRCESGKCLILSGHYDESADDRIYTTAVISESLYLAILAEFGLESL